MALTSALVLNAVIDAYRSYRREVYADRKGPQLEAQRDDFDQKLQAANQAYRDFLSRNNVGDYATAKSSYAKIYDAALAEKYTLNETIAQLTAKQAALGERLKHLSPEILLQRDLDLSLPNRLMALTQQRQELLARYQADAPPVVDINTQINALQGLMNSGSGIGEKEHKLGINTVYSDILKEKLDLESELAAQKGRMVTLDNQIGETVEKLQDLQGLESEFNNLTTEREALASNLKTFTQRLQEDNAARSVAKGADESVRVVEMAHTPSKASSLRMPVMAAGLIIALATALMVGMVRVFTRRGFGNARLAAQALDLPVLAQAAKKPA